MLLAGQLLINESALIAFSRFRKSSASWVQSVARADNTGESKANADYEPLCQ